MKSVARATDLYTPRLTAFPPASPARNVLMRQHWNHAAFLHWPVDAQEVSGLIHPDLEPDTVSDMAWVGLVPFRMVGIGLRRGPAIPRLGTFPETNIRTYVIGPDGPGVWFNSLDAARLLPVVVARVSYRLPYFHAAMRIERRHRMLTYNTIRRWPGPKGAGGTVRIEVGETIEPSPLELFLTARWRLYTESKGRLYSAEVRHPPWPLHRAKALAWDDELARAAGYSPMVQQPHVMYSPGVPVEVFPPQRIS